MTTALVILAVLVVIAVAAPRYGVDSRPGAVRARHTVASDVRVVLAWIGRAGLTPPARTRR